VRNNRIKRIISGHKPLDCCIGYVADCQIIGRTINPAPIAQNNMNIASEDVQKILDVCAGAGILDAHKFKNYNNGVLSFRRQRPDFCKLCKRMHDKDNTLMIVLVPRTNKVQILQKCRHNDTESAEIGEMLVDGLNVPVGTENASARSKRLDRIIQSFKPTVLNLAGITQNVYTADQLADYELAPTLIVHAQMKMGKTKKLKEHLQTHCTSADIIRFVSFRQTFSNSIKSSFPEFQLYTDVNGEIHDKRVIIQVESLWRLSYVEPPTLLILDECESIFEQFDSGLGGQLGGNFAILQWMMRYSRRVILMDAFITERTLNIVRKMRGGDIHYHRNTFSRDVDMEYAFTVDRATWLNKLTEVIGRNERVAIPVNSLTDGKSIQQFLLEKFARLRIKVYSSETLMSEKREHFSDVNKHWCNYDVIIYTPTLTAGVSFEMAYFHYVFAAFNDRSCGAETCMQMLGRVRNVINKQVYMLIDAVGNNLPDTREQICNSLELRRSNLVRNVDTTFLSFEINESGQYKYHNTDYFVLWIENTLTKNLSKNYFMQRVVNLCRQTGGKMRQMELFENELLSDYSSARTMVKTNKYQSIVNAAEIETADFMKIQEDIMCKRDVAPECMASLEKFRLRAEYKYTGVIDLAFVQTFYEPQVRATVRNLAKIMDGGTINENIASVRKDEISAHVNLMRDETTQYRDLRKTYLYNKHELAMTYITSCGWKTPQDTNFIHMNIITQNIRAVDASLRATIPLAVAEFEIRNTVITEDNYLRAWLKHINSVIDKFYGISIAPNANDKTVYQIRRNSAYETLSRLKHK
jgi:hypothetical protein